MDWWLIFSGFSQRSDRPHGCLRLYRRLAMHRMPHTELRLLTWDADVRALADEMATLGTQRVLVAAYSYGAGWGARRLAWHLQSRGIAIDLMLLSDPVHRTWFRPLNLRALLPTGHRFKPRIVLPATVRRVRTWRQITEPPFASPVYVPDPDEQVILVPNTPHVAMDDFAGWHDAVQQACLLR